MKNPLYQIIVIILLNFVSSITFSQSNSMEFIENKGQLLDENNTPVYDIDFYSMSKNFPCFIAPTEIDFAFYKSDTIGGTDTLHRIDIKFLDANPDSSIKTGLNDWHYNFYRPEYGTIDTVKSFNKIKYENMYRGIDLSYEAQDSGFSIQYFIHGVGGRLSDINFNINGVDTSFVDTAGIIAQLEANDQLILYNPICYDIDSLNNKIPLTGLYLKITDAYSFSVDGHVPGNDLVVDLRIFKRESGTSHPGLDWSTYYGGSLTDEANGLTKDASDNVYMTGLTYSVDFPSDNAVFPTNIGDADAFLIKFDRGGHRKWATYYGSDAFDKGISVANDNDEIYLCGSVYGNNLQLLDPGGGAYFENTFHNGFVADFDATIGNLTWGTYYGGTAGSPYENEEFQKIIVNNHSIYIGGRTQTSDFPLLDPGGSTYYSAAGQGVLFSFDADHVWTWSTRFGGDNGKYTRVNDIDFDDNDGMYIGGQSSYSSSFPSVVPTGAYTQSYGGSGFAEMNGFFAHFTNTDFDLDWSTYFGGSVGDRVFAIAYNAENNSLYGAGKTSSVTDLPVLSELGAYNNPSFNGGFSDGFVCRFDNAHTQEWTTYFGGTGIDELLDMQIDNFGNIYCTGDAELDGMEEKIMTDCYTQDYSGEPDAIIIAFKSDDDLIWSTFFGGNDFDEGHSMVITQDRELFLCGWTWSKQGHTVTTDDFPLENPGTGAYFQSSFNLLSGSGDKDAFISRFRLEGINFANIGHIQQNNHYNIYPNPNSIHYFYINDISESSELTIFDASGKILFDISLLHKDNKIDISKLVSGLYFVRVTSGINSEMLKLIVQ